MKNRELSKLVVRPDIVGQLFKCVKNCQDVCLLVPRGDLHIADLYLAALAKKCAQYAVIVRPFKHELPISTRQVQFDLMNLNHNKYVIYLAREDDLAEAKFQQVADGYVSLQDASKTSLVMTLEKPAKDLASNYSHHTQFVTLPHYSRKLIRRVLISEAKSYNYLLTKSMADYLIAVFNKRDADNSRQSCCNYLRNLLYVLALDRHQHKLVTKQMVDDVINVLG